MTAKPQQLRQSFLVTGGVVALALVVMVAILAGHSASVTLERLAVQRGLEVSNRVALSQLNRQVENRTPPVPRARA